MFSAANKKIMTLDIEGLKNTGLQVLAFDGIEGLNAEYVFEITLVNDHVRYDITQLLSKSAYLAFTPDNKNGAQGVHGVIQSVKRGAVGNHYAQYKIILAPRFTHLHKRFNQRAFVGKTVPEIVSAILAEYGQQQGQEFTYKFKETYPVREFCCQYEESDADFIYRLCEEEGIAIHYEFSQTNHNMVFTDAQPFFPSLTDAIQYMSDTGFVADKPVLKRFDVGLSSATQSASFRNYNFQTMKIPEGTAKGAQDNKANGATEPNLESYDYPNPHMDKGQGTRLAQREIQRLRANHILAEGYSDIPSLHAGYFFTVTGYPAIDTLDTDKPWLIKQIRHQGRQPQVIEALGDVGSADSSILPSQLDNYYRLPIARELQFPTDSFQQGYRNCLVATPQAVPYRPARFHPKPRVLGTQTAIITGASGEEIYCDEYGRVKLQFHWDREGQYDENSSHWIRVASSWAHDGYGAVVIPRVGMEVMIDFLEGDIDNPIVVGALHNGVNKHPYDLPANKTRSVFKTSSSKGGVGSNEFRIEDKTGEEQIFVQSQKDFDQLTKNNHTTEVKNNSHLQVNNEHSETIKKNRYTKNEMEEHHLTQLDRKTQIMGNDHKTVAMSEHTSIGTIKTTEAGMEIHLKSGMQTVVDGGLSLTLKAGGQHIVLNPAGIFMTTPQWMGGVPMVGSPSIPLPPLQKENAVAPVIAPAVQLNTALTTTKSSSLTSAQSVTQEKAQPTEQNKIKFNITLTDIPGKDGFPLINTPWEILYLPNGIKWEDFGYEPPEARLCKGKTDSNGKINLSDEDQAKLERAYKQNPKALWLRYPGQYRQLTVYIQERLSEQEKELLALDALGYFDHETNIQQSTISPQMKERFRKSHGDINAFDELTKSIS